MQADRVLHIRFTAVLRCPVLFCEQADRAERKVCFAGMPATAVCNNEISVKRNFKYKYE